MPQSDLELTRVLLLNRLGFCHQGIKESPWWPLGHFYRLHRCPVLNRRGLYNFLLVCTRYTSMFGRWGSTPQGDLQVHCGFFCLLVLGCPWLIGWANLLISRQKKEQNLTRSPSMTANIASKPARPLAFPQHTEVRIPFPPQELGLGVLQMPPTE